VPGFNDDQAQKIADFAGDTPVNVLAYHNFAGSQYEALGMKNTLPDRLPTDAEIEAAQKKMKAK
jgi:pyruvate-formate lyase-activating enzyme